MGKPELRAVEGVLRSRKFFRYGGPETAAFEREWTALLGCRHACAVSSGTGALIAGLQAMGVGPGQSVLVPAYTFVSTALAVTTVGAIPIVTGIDETLTMCPRDMERRIRRHTSCIIPVHMQGIPCDMRAILRVARSRGLCVLEDACQAAGGSYRGKRLGTLGHMGAFSFNQYKVLSCGEGGACVTSDKALAERAYMAQDGSCSVWPETGPMSQAFFCGGSFRFNEISAAILRVQVGRLDGILERLRAARRIFMDRLELPAGFRLVPTHDEAGNCGVCFLIRAPDTAAAERCEALMKPFVKVHRPINSGRHVYSRWDVLRGRVGGHHPDWDCFRHPKNRGIATNYDETLSRTDEILSCTLLCHTPYGVPGPRVERTVARLNQALKKFRLP